MTKIPTRKTDAWGTLVSVPRGVLQQWYPLIDGHRQVERTRKRLGHPSNFTQTLQILMMEVSGSTGDVMCFVLRVTEPLIHSCDLQPCFRNTRAS
jgi:hypothetical protein